jgi:3-methyl-2-oxobutanoate hydroxymethyltransferase
MEDMLGLNPQRPRFVREYAQLATEIEDAVKSYAAEVRSRRFPGKENVYPMSKGSRLG